MILVLNRHFQWWTRKGTTDPVRVKGSYNKYEVRNSKSETNLKFECPKVRNRLEKQCRKRINALMDR